MQADDKPRQGIATLKPSHGNDLPNSEQLDAYGMRKASQVVQKLEFSDGRDTSKEIGQVFRKWPSPDS